MKGRDFIGVPLMLTERAFRTHERDGKSVPILYPPGVDPALLEVGLVFSMEDADFRLNVKPERWLADGLVTFASKDEPAAVVDDWAPEFDAEPERDVEPEPVLPRKGRRAVSDG